MEQSADDSRTSVMHVRVISQEGESVLSLTKSDLLRRETEMKDAAANYGIDADRWSGSFLYTLWQDTGGLPQSINPEQDFHAKTYSKDHHWHNWLTEMIQSYYTTGKLHVPDDGGLDVLLALEYFGILYEPSQLSFASPKSFDLVRKWSDYFVHREVVAEWVVKYVQDHQLGNASEEVRDVYFATSPQPDETILVGSVPAVVFAGDVLPTPNVKKSVADIVHGLFNETSDPTVAHSMRQDFCQYLQHCLSGFLVSFHIEYVTVRTVDKVDKVFRPVLKIERLPTRRYTEPSLPHHGKINFAKTAENTFQNQNQHIDWTSEHINRIQRDHQQQKVLGHEGKLFHADHVYEDLARNTDLTLQVDIGHPDGQDYENAITEDPNDPVAADFVFDSAPTNVAPGPPISFIKSKTSKSEQSVTSSLSGPYSSEKGNIEDAGDVRAQALRHEWIQAGLLNRGIADRMEALLRVDTASVSEGNPLAPEVASPVHASRNAWEWFTGLGLCAMSVSLLKPSNCAHPVNCDPAQTPNGPTTAVLQTTLSTTIAAAKFLADGVEQTRQALLTQSRTDVSEKVASSKRRESLDTSHNQTHGVRVKDRLERVRNVIESSGDQHTLPTDAGESRSRNVRSHGIEVSQGEAELIRKSIVQPKGHQNQESTPSVATPTTASTPSRSVDGSPRADLDEHNLLNKSLGESKDTRARVGIKTLFRRRKTQA